jgi:hypothetical protein
MQEACKVEDVAGKLSQIPRGQYNSRAEPNRVGIIRVYVTCNPEEEKRSTNSKGCHALGAKPTKWVVCGDDVAVIEIRYF